MVLILKAIRNLRNQVVHRDGKVHCRNLHGFKKDEKIIVPTVNTKWLCPHAGVVKFNVDAAFSNASTTVAMVARNASGEELNAWAKGYISSEPLQAETYVVLWALNLAKADHHHFLVQRKTHSLTRNGVTKATSSS